MAKRSPYCGFVDHPNLRGCSHVCASLGWPILKILSIQILIPIPAPARSLLESGSFLNKDNESEVSRTPGYPAFLAAVMYVVGPDLKNVALAQSAIISLSVLLLYWLVRRILPPFMTFMGGILAAGSPWSAAHAGLLLTEGLYLLMLVLTFFAIQLGEDTTKRSGAVLGGGL